MTRTISGVAALFWAVACTAADPPPLTAADTGSGEPVADAGSDTTDAELDAATGEDTAPADVAVDSSPDTPQPGDVGPETSPDAVEDTSEPDVVEDVVAPQDAEHDASLPSYAGVWTGEWEAEGFPLSGTFAFTIDPHDGTEIEGVADFTGAPCFSTGFIEGTVVDGVFDVLLFDQVDPPSNIQLTGDITAETISGSFDAFDAGICTGILGTLSGTKIE